MPRERITSDWVFVDGTRDALSRAMEQQDPNLRSWLVPAYIIGMPVGSGRRPTKVWTNHDGHRSFPRTMACKVTFNVKQQPQLPF